MTEANTKIIELITKNYTINDIAKELNISHRQLYYRLFLLKNSGFNFKSTYYSNAETILQPKTLEDIITNKNNKNSIDLVTQRQDNTLKFIVISDIHKCNSSENFNYLDTVYEYAIKNKIHIILNCGDLIEGIRSIGGVPSIRDIDKQVDKLIDEYPFDPSILNFTILGNHDIHPLIRNNQDLKTILENRRRDIIPIGYAQGTINVKNDKISLYHPIDNINNDINSSTINLHGHSHKFVTKVHSSGVTIYVPSLSNIKYYSDRLCSPEALEFKLKFNNGNITGFDLTQLLITEKEALILSENIIQLNYIKNKSQKDQPLETKELPKVRKR